MPRITRLSVLFIIGILITGMALFANRFGLDPNPAWSKSRVVLLMVGLLIAFAPWIIHRRNRALLERHDLFALPVLLLVIAVYFGSITISRETTSNYYSLLAASFRNGQLSLPLQPDPALLQLQNPYDPAERQGVKAPLDLSLYDGKFYLYWGPAPSALLALVQPFLPNRLADVDLLFLFLCGIFLVQYLLILYLWEKFFPAIPKWTLLVSTLLAGLANPILWMLSQPKIYEAAIAGAQFFFIAGFFLVVLALDTAPASVWKLALAGCLWALAVNTRTVAAFPVIFMTMMVLYRLLRTRRASWSQPIGGLFALGLPLAIGALGFVGYNWARFGSLLETGFTYQLAGPHLQQHMHELFSPGYIAQNAYNYLLHPFVIKASFPFVFPTRGLTEPLFRGMPAFYMAQAVTGFLPAVPFTVFAALPVLGLRASRSRVDDSSAAPQGVSLAWITAGLLGSFLLPFISLLAFFWAAMRYAEDFMPALVLLGIIGFWQGYQQRSERVRPVKMYATLGVLLAALSILLASLLALSIYYTSGLLGG